LFCCFSSSEEWVASAAKKQLLQQQPLQIPPSELNGTARKRKA